MIAPKKIIFEGFYGFKNTGDDAFVEVSSWGAQKFWNCQNNVFLGNSLPKTVCPFNKKQFLPNLKGTDRLNLLAHLQNSDYLISAGGSTFGNYSFHSNKALAFQRNKIFGKPKLGAIGVSIGPFKNTAVEKKINQYLSALDFLAVRDNRSFEYVNNLNLPYKPINAFDLAAMLPMVYKDMDFQKNLSTRKTIGISICNYESYTGGNIEKEKKRNLFFKELVEMIAQKTDVHFKVFIINGNAKTGDVKISHWLMENVDKSRLEFLAYPGDVKKVWEEILNCSLMISTRLHASVFSCYAQIPFLLLEYHQKCTDFLADVGQNETWRLYDADISVLEGFEKTLAILEGNYQFPSKLLETIEKSQKNFTHTIPFESSR